MAQSQQPIRHFNSLKVYLLALNTMISGFLLGYTAGVFNPCMSNVSHSLGWGKDELAYIAMCAALVPAGACMGGLSSSYLGNRLGRLRAIIYADALGILAAGVTIIPYTASFAAGRFLSGFMIGLQSAVSSTYISEISPKEIRGQTGGIFQLMRMLGLTSSFAMGLPLPTDDFESPMNNWWMAMFALPSIFNVIQATIFLTVFRLESPYWLATHGMEKETHNVLSSIYTDEETEHIMYDQISHAQEDPLVHELEGNLFKKINVLFTSPKFRKMVRLAILFGFAGPLTGYSAIVSYSTMLFTEIGGDIFVARQYTVILGVSGIVGAIIMLQLIERFGRKKLLIYGMIVMTVSELANASFLTGMIPTYIPTMIMVYIFMVAFSISIGPIHLIYMSEVSISMVVGLSVAVFWLSVVITVVCVPYIIHNLGVGIMFYIFGFISLVSLIYFAFDVFETKGLTKEQIRVLATKELGAPHHATSMSSADEEQVITPKPTKVSIEITKQNSF